MQNVYDVLCRLTVFQISKKRTLLCRRVSRAGKMDFILKSWPLSLNNVFCAQRWNGRRWRGRCWHPHGIPVRIMDVEFWKSNFCGSCLPHHISCYYVGYRIKKLHAAVTEMLSSARSWLSIGGVKVPESWCVLRATNLREGDGKQHLVPCSSIPKRPPTRIWMKFSGLGWTHACY